MAKVVFTLAAVLADGILRTYCLLNKEDRRNTVSNNDTKPLPLVVC